MSHLQLSLCCAVLFGLTATGEAKSPVAVYTSYEQTPSDAAVEEMQAELEAIMLPIGLELEWRSLEKARGNEVAAELVVVAFKGSCRMDSDLPASMPPGALGWTHMSDGDVLPFADVSCDRIRRLIHPLVGGLERFKKEAALGRAIARVVAHELYHVFADTTKHGKGIAKPFYTAAELTVEQFRFHEKETRILRGGRLKALLRDSQPGPAASGQ